MPVCVWFGAALPGGVESGVGGLAMTVYGSSVAMPGLLGQGSYSHLVSSGCRQQLQTGISVLFCGC